MHLSSNDILRELSQLSIVLLACLASNDPHVKKMFAPALREAIWSLGEKKRELAEIYEDYPMPILRELLDELEAE
jgi:hypothetical protein